jgi:predicted alpha/beta-hydrolase family hydrolase
VLVIAIDAFAAAGTAAAQERAAEHLDAGTPVVLVTPAAPEPRVEACVFLGFPLHPAKQPATKRAEHLPEVPVPMLFVQGTRDALAEPALLRPIVAKLPRATLHEIDGADHGFAVPRRQRDPRLLMQDIAVVVGRWLDGLPSPSA